MGRFSRSRASTSRRAVALSTLAALSLAGCSSSCQEAGPAEGPERSDTAPPVERVATDLGSPDHSDPEERIDAAPGEALILYENGRVSMVSNRYPRIGLLGKLSREVGFEMTRPEPGARSANLTLRLLDATVEEAIATALTGVEFQIHYVYDAEQKRSVLSRVNLGRPRSEPVRGGARGRESRGPGNDRHRPRADGREPSDSRNDEIAVALASSDPDVRSEAVDRLEPEGEELETLKDLLAHDRSSLVRRSAAERLETSDSRSAIDALVDALDDPDPSVVLAAIDAHEFAADSEHLPRILASGGDRHTNPEVREAFDEMVEFLE
jgi:hypothetical protein